MTITQEKSMIMPESPKKGITFSEFFDVEIAFTPGEISIAEEKIAW